MQSKFVLNKLYRLFNVVWNIFNDVRMLYDLVLWEMWSAVIWVAPSHNITRNGRYNKGVFLLVFVFKAMNDQNSCVIMFNAGYYHTNGLTLESKMHCENLLSLMSRWLPTWSQYITHIHYIYNIWLMAD